MFPDFALIVASDIPASLPYSQYISTVASCPGNAQGVIKCGNGEN